MLRGWWVLVLSGLVAAAVALVLLLGIHEGTRHQVAMRSEQGKYGFSIEMPISFATAHTVVSGSFQVDGHAYSAGFFNSSNGLDEDHPAMPMDVNGGDRLSVDTGIVPSCEEARPTPPVLTVVSRGGDGMTFEDRFTVSNPRDYVAAVASWCRFAIHGAVLGGTVNPGHSASFRLQLFNTTASPIRVTSKAFRNGATTWAQVSVVVPPHEKRTLTVAADGRNWGLKPWSMGLLVADGQVIHLGR